MKILLKNGNIVTDKVFKGSILINGNTIEEVTQEDTGKIFADEIIDCTDKYIMPGLIDMHAHLREPGMEYKEDLQSGANAAVHGGITTVCCMANTSPVIDNDSIVDWIRKRSKEIGLADIIPYGAVTKGLKGEELTEMGMLLEAGVCGFSDDGRPVRSAEVMRRALEYASYFDAFVAGHEEDETLFDHGSVNEGYISAKYGFKAAPAEAESIMVGRDIQLARLTGGRAHFCHISSKHSIELIKRAKECGIKVTTEVTPHHLLLTEQICSGFDTNTKMNPPLRTDEDRKILIEALKSGVIDCITTDHAPHHIDDKFKEYDLAAYGVIGFQLLIPSLIQLINSGDLTWAEFAKAASTNPAKLLKLNDRGELRKGKLADIVVIDSTIKYTFDDIINKSRSKNTPYWGKELQGMATLTLREGRIVVKS